MPTIHTTHTIHTIHTSHTIHTIHTIHTVHAHTVVYASNDMATVALLLLPVGAIITAAALVEKETVSKSEFVNNLTVCAMYIGGRDCI